MRRQQTRGGLHSAAAGEAATDGEAAAAWAAALTLALEDDSEDAREAARGRSAAKTRAAARHSRRGPAQSASADVSSADYCLVADWSLRSLEPQLRARPAPGPKLPLLLPLLLSPQTPVESETQLAFASAGGASC